MDPKLFQELPNSTNAVESHNCFGRPAHREPLKMTTYKEDMAKTIQIMARRKGLSTTYDDQSESAQSKCSSQQSLARRKRYQTENDDPEKPPDTKKKFNPGK